MDSAAIARAVEHGDPIAHDDCPAGDGVAVYTGMQRGRAILVCTGCGEAIATRPPAPVGTARETAEGNDD